MLVPDVSAQWNQNDQIQINFSTPSLRNFCIQTILHKTYYKNPDIKECQEIKKADTFINSGLLLFIVKLNELLIRSTRLR